MLIDLKAHYLDLIVTAIEAGGNACLHRPSASSQDRGTIYVTRKPKLTKADYVMDYEFGPTAFHCRVQFSDERPTFLFNTAYVKGLEDFWPAFRKALSANRLPDKTHEPERGPDGDYSLVSARNQ